MTRIENFSLLAVFMSMFICSGLFNPSESDNVSFQLVDDHIPRRDIWVTVTFFVSSNFTHV